MFGSGTATRCGLHAKYHTADDSPIKYVVGIQWNAIEYIFYFSMLKKSFSDYNYICCHYVVKC